MKKKRNHAVKMIYKIADNCRSMRPEMRLTLHNTVA